MPKNAYFAGYHYPYQTNPNIIIVPTVSFCPPHTGTEQITELTSTPTSPLHCEQKTPVEDNIGEQFVACRSNWNQQILQPMQPMASNTSNSIEFSDNFKNSQYVIQDKISSEAPAFNKNQSIQDLSKSKNKSRRNLVDLTGFNLPKRKRSCTSSLPKHKDLSKIRDAKIEDDESKHQDYTDNKTDNITKESSTSGKPTSTQSDRNKKNISCELKENKKDMEHKKYLEQPSKRSFEKFIDKTSKEKYGRAIKNSSKTKQEYKDSKEQSSRGKGNLQVSNSNSTNDLRDKIVESSRGKPNLEKKSNGKSSKDLRNKIIESSHDKPNLQKVYNSNSTKDLRNKIIDSSKKYHDREKRSMAKYTKRSKSETNSRHLPESKVYIKDRNKDLRPDSKRHSDDHKIKCESGNEIKTENLPHKKIRIESDETTTNKPVIINEVDERKKPIKSGKRDKVNTNQTNLVRVENYTNKERAIDQNNTDRVKLINSGVRVNKNVHNLSQSQRVRSATPTGVQDLRLRLSRKRTKNEYFEDQEPMENGVDKERLMITIKQDVKADSKKSPILAPTVNKPKSRKCKKIKLIINIECSNFDSDSSDQDLNECCSSPDDLSFLDDFNIDEIVDSLNNSQVEPNNTIIIDNDYKNNEQTKPKEGLINDVKMKAIKVIKKEETSSHKGQVIEINSDTEDDDMNIEMGSVAKKCKDEQNMDENSKVDRNIKQEATNITDLTGIAYEDNAPKKIFSKLDTYNKQEADYLTELTGKGYEENKPKEAMDPCNDEQNIKTHSKVDINIKQESNYITDLTGIGYERNKPKEAMDPCNDEQNIKTHSKVDRNIKQGANYITDLTEIGYERNKQKEAMDPCNDEQNIKTHSKVDINIKQESNYITDLTEIGYERNKPKEAMDPCNDEQNIKTHSKVDRNIKQGANYITDLTEIGYERNKQKEAMDPCNDEQNIKTHLKVDRNTKLAAEANKETDLNGKYCDKNTTKETINLSDDDSVIEVIDISDENEYYTTKHLQPKKTIQTSALEKNALKVNFAKSKFQLKPSFSKITSLDTKNSHYTQHEDKIDITAKQKLEPTNIIGKKQTLSLQTKFNIEKNKSDNSIGVKSDMTKQLDTNSIEESLNVADTKENLSQKSGSISKKSLETIENILENANNKNSDIIPVCRSNNNIKDHLQTFENTVNKPKDKLINNIEKKTNNDQQSLPQSKNKLLIASINSTKGTLETEKCFAENYLSSPQIDIRPQSSLGQNNKPKGKPLQKSVETIKTSSKAAIDNGEQKINIKSESNRSHKDMEEKELLTLENSEVKSEKSPERSNIQHKTNVATGGKLTNPDKNIELTSRRTSIAKAENLLTANNKETTLTSKKSNVENQTESESMKNNTQKLETIDNACDLNKITVKGRELGKRSEIATNTKKKQRRKTIVVSNKSLVSGGSKNKDVKISNKHAEVLTPPMQAFSLKLESQMSEYLQKKCTFSSVIHDGRCSTIYKCTDTSNETYAVKVVTQRTISNFMEEMSSLLQQYRPRHESLLLYLMSAFKVDNQWCLITEYYPKNLIQALHEYPHGFHIDQVQVLSRQLVDAVNSLTNIGVIHSDIKPAHILLNSAYDRLKLCGFDRSNYGTCLHITPTTGTSSYRAPEMLLGFQVDHRIDIWSTALVIFEMATKKRLFEKGPNNVILYQQLFTFGNINYSMLNQSRFAKCYFYGTSFKRKIYYKNYEETILVHSFEGNNYLRRALFQSYDKQWARCRTKWQTWNDMNKLELLQTLLEQMLVLDPRNRIPMQFVGSSQFMDSQFRMT